MHNLQVFKLQNNNSLDFIINHNKANLVLVSPNINHPLFSLGFHHFIDRTRGEFFKLIETEVFKNEFYYIVNPFEYLEDDLANFTKLFFKKYDDNLVINTSDFYKIWEIIYLFDIVNFEQFTYSVLSEKSETIYQAISFFRTKFLNNDIKKDIVYFVKMTPEKDSIITEQFLNNKVSKKTPLPKKNKDVKSILQFDNIDKFEQEKKKKKLILIVANGENISENIINKEQESYKLILGEIINVLKNQDINGNFIIKIFDTFTMPTIKLIYILSLFYEECFLYKPLFSRPSSAEKYIICKKFKSNNKKLNQAIDVLELIFNKINTNDYLNDIFIDEELPAQWINMFKFINVKLVNNQQININKIIKYIKENNYFGDKYHEYKNMQIESTKWWISQFFPSTDVLYNINKEILNKLLVATIAKNNLEKDSFLSNLKI